MWARVPPWVDFCFPSFIWRKETEDPIIHLTFDDGPSQYTLELLSLLENDAHKGTFFLLGSQVEKYPELIERIRQGGHTVGVHGFEHLDAWKTGRSAFMSDFHRASQLIPATLYRPPYGHFRKWMTKAMPRGMQLVMWSRSSGDYVSGRSPNEIADRTLRRIRKGEVIVLHDNDRHHPKTLQALEIILPELKAKGLRSEAL